MLTTRKMALAVFVLSVALFGTCLWYYYPQLPDRLPSHFGFTGQPDAWSTKSSFIMVLCSIMAVTVIVFLGLAFVMPLIPTSLINLPNKDYWLSQERRQRTFDILSSSMLWFGAATLLYLLDMARQSFQVALGKERALPHPMGSLGLYLVFTAAWVLWLLAKFRRPAGT